MLLACLLARSNSEFTNNNDKVCKLELIQGGMPQLLLAGNDAWIALDCGRAG